MLSPPRQTAHQQKAGRCSATAPRTGSSQLSGSTSRRINRSTTSCGRVSTGHTTYACAAVDSEESTASPAANLQPRRRSERSVLAPGWCVPATGRRRRTERPVSDRHLGRCPPRRGWQVPVASDVSIRTPPVTPLIRRQSAATARSCVSRWSWRHCVVSNRRSVAVQHGGRGSGVAPRG